MMELKVTLDFNCCACERSVSAVVKCEGKGLLAFRPVAAVKIPCPNCDHWNQLCFEPNGTIRAVRPFAAPLLIPEPSLN